MKKLLVVPLMIALAVALILGGCAKPAPAPAPVPAPAPAPAPTAAPKPSRAPSPEEAEIYPGVTLVDVFRGFNSAYLIKGEKIAIIDTGPAQPLEDYIAPALEKLGMTPADIDFIFNTHIHFDHTGGAAALKNASDAQILIHTDEAGYLENPEVYIDQYIVPAVEVIMGKAQAKEQKERFLGLSVPSVKVDRSLNDGDIIELGGGLDLKVIHLPGHTPGSVGYYLEEAGIIFVGDSVQGLTGPRGSLPIIDDLDAYEKSLERLQKLSLKMIVKAHPSRSITIPNSFVVRSGDIKQYLEDSLEFTRKLREVAKSVAPGFPEKPFVELYNEAVLGFPEEWGLKPSQPSQIPLHGATTLLNVIKQIKK